MKNWVPILSWLPTYQADWLKADVIAGATIWAVVVPLAMACAVLVGVGPVYGLYTLPLALLGYAVFGGSRLMAVAPDTAVAVMAGGVVAAFVATGSAPVSIAIALAVIAGIIYLIFYIFKMGWIADLIPEPVLKGFVEGIVWLTILKQMTALFGLGIDKLSSGFHNGFLEIIHALPTAHSTTTLVGLGSIALLLVIRRFFPRVPGSLVVLVGVIVLVELLDLSAKGMAILGTIEGGLPDWSLVLGIDFSVAISLVPSALAIAILGYTKSLAALKQATKHAGESVDPNPELLALGVCNIGAGLCTGYAIAGSLTATTVGISSGAKSQVSNIVAAILSVLTLLFLLPLIANLALSSLAAIIIVALLGLSDVNYFRNLWVESRVEFAIGAAAFLGVLTFGVMPGVMIGVVLALFKLGFTIHSPTTAVVGRTPSGGFVDIDEHPDAKEIPGMLIWRQYGPLSFLNARVLTAELRSVVKEHQGIKVVVFDATTSAGVDTTATEAVMAVKKDLEMEGIDFWLVNPRQVGWNLTVATLKAAKQSIPLVFESLSDAVSRFEEDRSNVGGNA